MFGTQFGPSHLPRPREVEKAVSDEMAYQSRGTGRADITSSPIDYIAEVPRFALSAVGRASIPRFMKNLIGRRSKDKSINKLWDGDFSDKVGKEKYLNALRENLKDKPGRLKEVLSKIYEYPIISYQRKAPGKIAFNVVDDEFGGFVVEAIDEMGKAGHKGSIGYIKMNPWDMGTKSSFYPGMISSRIPRKDLGTALYERAIREAKNRGVEGIRVGTSLLEPHKSLRTYKQFKQIDPATYGRARTLTGHKDPLFLEKFMRDWNVKGLTTRKMPMSLETVYRQYKNSPMGIVDPRIIAGAAASTPLAILMMKNKMNQPAKINVMRDVKTPKGMIKKKGGRVMEIDEILSTPLDQSRGLQYKNFKKPVLFPRPLGKHTFTMDKPGLKPMDIIGLKGGRITGIKRNVKPWSGDYNLYGDAVVEAPAGYAKLQKLRKGSKVNFRYGS